MHVQNHACKVQVAKVNVGRTARKYFLGYRRAHPFAVSQSISVSVCTDFACTQLK